MNREELERILGFEDPEARLNPAAARDLLLREPDLLEDCPEVEGLLRGPSGGLAPPGGELPWLRRRRRRSRMAVAAVVVAGLFLAGIILAGLHGKKEPPRAGAAPAPRGVPAMTSLVSGKSLHLRGRRELVAAWRIQRVGPGLATVP